MGTRKDAERVGGPVRPHQAGVRDTLPAAHHGHNGPPGGWEPTNQPTRPYNVLIYLPFYWSVAGRCYQPRTCMALTRRPVPPTGHRPEESRSH